MASSFSHHDELPLQDADLDLHPPASNQRSYQPQPPPEAESSSPSPSSQLDSPQPTFETPLHLPTSRQFLTSLITAISNIPLFDEPPAAPPPPTSQAKTTNLESDGKAETETAIQRKQLLQVLKDEGDGQANAIGKGKKTGDSVNPLKLVPPEYRHLIITLHVLFPTVVLPALEVLERGLVERFMLRSSAGEATVVMKKEEQKEKEKEGADVVMGEDDKYEDENADLKEKVKLEKSSVEGQAKRVPEFYLVRSSQFLTNHFKRKRKKTSMGLDETLVAEATGAEVDRNQVQRYLVSLEAWNCTCAAFAFACVSEAEAEPQPEPETAEKDRKNQGEIRERQRDKVGSAGWTFGGMTLFDARDHSSVPPVCKHLLACLLADKWRGALGRYVTERVVSREEMAGIVADV